MTRDDFLRTLHSNPVYAGVINAVTGSEGDHVRAIVGAFTGELAAALASLAEQLEKNPDLHRQVYEALKDRSGVVKQVPAASGSKGG